MRPEFIKVEVNDILGLRHQVLRSGKPLSTAHFDGDLLNSTLHFAAFQESKIVGCLSLMNKNHSNFDEQNAYQLRGMAVDKNYRHKNIGKELIKFSESEIKNRDINLIWCNVRISAVNFYFKNGYEKIGDVFKIKDVGPHILMFKKL